MTNEYKHNPHISTCKQEIYRFKAKHISYGNMQKFENVECSTKKTDNHQHNFLIIKCTQIRKRYFARRLNELLCHSFIHFITNVKIFSLRLRVLKAEFTIITSFTDVTYIIYT